MGIYFFQAIILQILGVVMTPEFRTNDLNISDLDGNISVWIPPAQPKPLWLYLMLVVSQIVIAYFHKYVLL